MCGSNGAFLLEGKTHQALIYHHDRQTWRNQIRFLDHYCINILLLSEKQNRIIVFFHAFTRAPKTKNYSKMPTAGVNAKFYFQVSQMTLRMAPIIFQNFENRNCHFLHFIEFTAINVTCGGCRVEDLLTISEHPNTAAHCILSPCTK